MSVMIYSCSDGSVSKFDDDFLNVKEVLQI